MSKKDTNKSLLQRFSRSTKGATAVVFSFLAIPFIAISAGVADYGIALRVKAELTQTLDAAMLAATQAYALDNTADVSKIVNDFVEQNYTDSGKILLSSSLVVNDPVVSENGEISARLDVKVPSKFLTLVGYNEFDFSISSSAIVGGRSLEIALVLDNTWSMNGAKIASLKSSAQNLVDQLMTDDSSNVKMALVPFADYVNIGTDNRNEPGLDIPSSYTVSESWEDTRSTVRRCEYREVHYSCVKDGIPSTCTRSERYDCRDVPNENQGKVYNWETTYDWYGCMASRPHDLNVRDEDYATGVPGLMQSWDSICRHISPVTRLTTDKDAITSALEDMKADNEDRLTYIPTGLAWGWRLISDIAPFADGVSYDDEAVTKVIVLMTDGDNTLQMQKRNNAATRDNAGEVWMHDKDKAHGADISVTNGFTSQLCSNIKARGIVIHTIAFDVEEGSPIETLMRNCAGNGGKYFDADDSAELAIAFKQIAVALLNLRLSR